MAPAVTIAKEDGDDEIRDEKNDLGDGDVVTFGEFHVDES